ncbi:hypothetical protein [Synechococcus elongatus]|uniref:Uncharacterized protein n=2 Tax=Synechococcus elongatus TaxID=32046 RepID=Q31PE3_SYNE7|nr:hypothetical protein [Synechococcus elongatus]ABB57076.1 conserved hypothetical protein [Synechococcus elongatus PCC 7942 = FACHB-805]AJD58407.1 hypothetical protein M744_11450 [Synechococcus elongatus UTEX 2973]MBD2587477.1 hypothetical protein [Synechococcus elongatus FACHB-242]MBD2688744.1 hypothetical protein [Synechococcus elongatus FACHB-1061]MBD2707815.1 hypothetical protein [Synechococcus elongatus PCC 7942 = FACHB-805]
MLTLISTALTWGLRLFGCFWLMGGLLALQQARQAHLMDNLLEALSQEKEDRLTSRFLLIGSVLTFMSGAGLILSSQWVLIPLALLVLSQLIYFRLKEQRFQRATNEEERLDATVQSSTENAFIVSLVVAIAAFLCWRLGGLR